MRLNNLVDIVGCHAEGEVGDVVVGGVGNVPGATMFDKRNYLQSHRDDLRLRLLREPRGNVIRSVNVVLPSNNPKAVMGYVIMESTEYPAMSGSNTICVATVLLETGMIPMEEPVTRFTLEAPAGLIDVECQCRNGKVTSVRFVNQPAFVYQLDATINVPGIGALAVDVAWGGMCYVIVDAASAGFKLEPTEGRELRVMGERIKAAAIEQLPPAVHPVHPEYPGITNLSFTSPLERVDGVLRARNAVIVSPGRIDRSPCGTGTSARLAVMHARGQIGVGERFIHESIVGTTFDAVVESTSKQGSVDAIIPSIAGQGWITQLIKVGLDPTDPFPTGYALSDTWLEPMYSYETTT
ncbi:MAG: proline racemase family protein [Mycobacterium sp.]